MQILLEIIDEGKHLFAKSTKFLPGYGIYLFQKFYRRISYLEIKILKWRNQFISFRTTGLFRYSLENSFSDVSRNKERDQWH